jgi:hypothetical protein
LIILCGIASEPSLKLVIDAVHDLQAPHVVLHQRAFASMHMGFEVGGLGLSGWLNVDGHGIRLEEVTAVYSRLMDYRRLPEIEAEPLESALRQHCAAFHDTLMRWYEITPGRVLSRAATVGVNYSKPFEAQLIQQHGFAIPETLITNEPEHVRAFRDEHPRMIYKSISYVRSIVKLFEDSDLDRLEVIRACPTQFQEYIEGTNVRVHTVGSKAFATAIEAKSTDYRYAYLEGDQEHLQAIELPDELNRRCVDLSRSLGLDFAGIDLKLTPGGAVYCLEVNPCPAFSYYQLHTGQPIAQAVATWLAEAQ